MRNYLDPVYLAITDEAWQKRVYSDIFDSLQAMLDYIKEVEITTNTRYQLVRFKMSDELFAQIYNNNPFKNEPKIQAFYTRLFNDILLEVVSKRADWCPSLSCPPFHQNIPRFKFENNCIPNDVLTEWNKLLSQCLSCQSNDLVLYLLTPAHYQTVVTGESDFIKITRYVVQLFEIPRFLSENILSEAGLKIAVDILYQQRVLTENWEATQQAQDYVFDDFFWETIENNRLVDEDDEYKERFISTLAQVVYDTDVNIRKHKYGKITKYTQYSADIFKMGRGRNDNRCSRIFYYKIKSVIHFYEYNPDFHKGE